MRWLVDIGLLADADAYTVRSRAEVLLTGLGFSAAQMQEAVAHFSGGWRMRLQLARALMCPADLMLLDEPTSGVDPITERRIYENVFAAFQDRCVVSALHGLHLLPMFDEIYLLDRGRVVAHGSFDKLLTSSPLFQDMWRHDEAAAT